ncbi:WXG100 family type VII secretion target [Micromonospora inyonensis]|uniref:WXG100 family type VII secretion target n=1 Tax=Micromonospora inyonensis TaxID=47866 RepID=A0A1C6R7X9_9ACTN|nr:WXG100 family type VII secretion target [Micromonospora inyonensis]SCL13149.1 WXG100 family type VII secretion target [Micromonospora inyonensis]
MANYSINPAAVQTVADEMARETRELDQSLATLQASVDRFTAANNGQAPEAYKAAQALWNQGQQEMRAALALGQARLQEINVNYQHGDNRGAAIFS